MQKISASIWFQKRVFPVLWFGGWGLAALAILAAGDFQNGTWIFLVIPILMALGGFFLLKNLIWDLVDEVFDCGDALLVKNGDEEERIPLSNIMHVNATTMVDPPRITLRLVNPGRFGSEVSFSPSREFSFNPFAKNPVAEDLIVRVDRARRAGGH